MSGRAFRPVRILREDVAREGGAPEAWSPGAVQELVRYARLCCGVEWRRPMAEICITEDQNGRWTVYTAGLVVTDLTREAAEAFAASYRRVTAG
ncbi:hypothetical protein ME121_6216 [Methylobacterium sp. ME121]|nr:hypothetical protein ME121_6216 [Methylobacterium sp. ME121]